MKPLSETLGLERLRAMKDRLRANVAVYEAQAESCRTCDTPGACCLDEHFVNVRISRLEATAIVKVIDSLPPIRRHAVQERISHTVSVSAETFACPLYEKSIGCLVHSEAKPVPCTVHACYNRVEDLPPDELQNDTELAIEKLNNRVYSSASLLEPLPVAVQSAILRTRRKNAITSPATNQPAT